MGGGGGKRGEKANRTHRRACLPWPGESGVRNILVTSGDRSSYAEPEDWQVRWTKSTKSKLVSISEGAACSVLELSCQGRLMSGVI